MFKQGFITNLVDVPLPDGRRWRIYRDLVWQWRDGSREVLRHGTVTDYASVPDLAFFAGLLAAAAHHFGWDWLFWPAVVVCILAKWIDDDPKTDGPAAFHDQDYTRQNKSRWTADWHLVLRMVSNRRRSKRAWLDVVQLILVVVKSAIYWLNLRLFGWTHWYFRKPQTPDPIRQTPN